MRDVTRRNVLTAVAVGGSVALAGCSSGGGGSTDSSIVTNIDVVEKEEPYTRLVLAVDLVEEHGIDELALQDSEGSVITDGGVDPAQTRAELSLEQANLSPETYELIAYTGDSITGRTEWTPSVDINIEDAEIVYNHTLSVELDPVGDIPVTATDAYLTEGYVVEGDETGRINRATEVSPYSNRNVLSIEGNEGLALLTPPGGECNGSDQELSATIEFENRKSINFEIILSMGDEGDIDPTGESCSGTTVESITKL